MQSTNSSALLESLKQIIIAPGLADLGAQQRPGIYAVEQLNRLLEPLLKQSVLPQLSRDLIRGALLLWHDHLDKAHEIAQGIENADGSLLHAIMHRREPDYGNSKYWFRRVGKHPCYSVIAERALKLFGNADRSLATQLLPDGAWDPFALVDACEKAARSTRSDSEKKVLMEIQRIEFESMIERFCS